MHVFNLILCTVVVDVEKVLHNPHHGNTQGSHERHVCHVPPHGIGSRDMLTAPTSRSSRMIDIFLSDLMDLVLRDGVRSLCEFMIVWREYVLIW